MKQILDQYRCDRLSNAEAIRALGIDPYGQSIPKNIRDDWEPACNLAWSSLKFENKQIIPNMERTADNGPFGAGSGRIVLRRDMGNLHFLTIQDETGDIQIALNKKRLPELDWKLAKLLDLGDLVYFEGTCAPTKKGEPTVWVNHLRIATKAIAPPPDKVEGLVDIEQRYRKRYTDLWSNPEVMKIALLRSKIIRSIREYLYKKDFSEVETPILQTIAGGAAAKPFETYHNALGIPMFLRIAPELYLKRLLVGGMTKVFEIGRNFRNEGISAKHNPEFTSLEIYEAYSDHEQMATFVEKMIRSVARGNTESQLQGVEFNGTDQKPWRRARMEDLAKEWMKANEWTIPPDNNLDWLYNFFQKHVETTIIEPTFVTHLPSSAVPLAKDDGHGYALAWELIVQGNELGCGYTELTDPIRQREKLEKQIGTHESHSVDDDFLEALSVGMPPTGGVGIGIDRLVMWLTGTKSIRDVILFPTIKPQ